MLPVKALWLYLKLKCLATSEVFAAYPDLSCKGEFIPVNQVLIGQT